MELEFPAATFKAVQKAGAKSEVFHSDIDYATEIDSKHVLPEDYGLIRKVVSDPKTACIENKRILRKINALDAFQKADFKTARVTKLELLPDAIRKVMEKAQRKWIFVDQKDGDPLPYIVTNVKFRPAEQTSSGYTPAYVQLSSQAVSRGEETGHSIMFERIDLVGSVIQILGAKDAVLESDELLAAYEKDMVVYREWKGMMGEQFLARGTGQVADGNWREGAVSLDRENIPSKVVMDDDINWGKDDGMADTAFWKGDDDDDSDERDSFSKPVHPFVRAFNLGTHEFVETHISNLTPYAYDEKVSGKLVLTPESRELIDILTSSAVKKMDDIVKGKAAGVVVICSGKPGTGKTLTAEVYSEAARHPLYTVQCSQLGTDEEKLEEKLSAVLERATRWRAILLIDEADVYIHERGTDIRQNAIVGVFLRLLEYYSGILFLTTNRVTIIDDAILSRATAHVKYEVLCGPQYTKLWRVLFAQYEVSADDHFVADVIKEFPKISGRSIRQLIRLARIIANGRKEKGVGLSDLKSAAAFHDFTELEKD